MKILAGSTNVSVYYYIVQDASAGSPGEPVIGLLFSDIETGGSASYVRQGAARVDLTLITLASASAAHADGGFILVDDTNMPGVYRCDYPDAAFATGVDLTVCSIVVASGKNAVAAPIEVVIDDSVVQTADHTADIAAILSDTNEMQTDNLPGRFDGVEGATFDTASDSLEAIRNRGDIAWITGGGGGITQILNVQPVLPTSIDLADTSTVRLGLILINSLDDLPTTAEITPGTISIDRKAIGGTSWSAVITDSAMSEQAGMVYFDEVFDSGSAYAEGDSIRVTFKSVSINADANVHEICDANGLIFQTEIRETMRGTDSALTDKTGFSLSTAGILAIWHQLTSAIVTAGTIGKLLVDNINAAITSRATSTKQNTMETTLNTILADQDSMGITKNVALPNFEFPMVLTTDGRTAATGKTVTGEMSLDGANFVAVNGAIAEVGSGVYQCDLTADDTNAIVITYKFSATDCDDTVIPIITRD